MKLLYAVMYTEHADFSGASYVDGKVQLVGLTEQEIADSPREKNRIDKLDLSTDELTVIIDGLAAQEANHIMGVLSKPQGKWLKYNHPDFMDKPEEEL
jgi:hypothetical protein